MARSYVIHLARSTARVPLVDELRKGLPALEIVEAVDGRSMSAEALAEVAAPHLSDPKYPFGLMPSEIGAFLSHRKAWAAVAASDAEYAFIAEDDVSLGPDFADALRLAEAYADSDRLIRFPMHPREEPDRIIGEQDGITLFRPKVIGLTAALYLLGRNAAAQLLERSVQFDRPVDTWLQMRWETGVDSLTLWPAHIRSAADETGGSTIQAKKSALSEVKRGWQRARYRAEIKRLSGQA